MERIFNKFFGAIFFLPGLALVCYILYSEIPWFIREYTWSKAIATVESIEGKEEKEREYGPVILTLSFIDEEGKFRQVKKEYYRDSEISNELGVGDEKKILYEPQNPDQVYFVNTWWGVLIGLLFGGVFMLIGYYIVSKSARAKFAEWNKGFRLGFTVFLAAGVITLIMAIFESAFFLFFGIPFTLLGGFGLYRFNSKERLKAELPRTGQRIECTNIIVEQDTIIRGYSPDTGERLSPYIIKCYATEPSTNLPFVFESELIWFDPKPNLRDTITVYVNPRDYTEYVMDISFLPKETRRISQRNFRIG